MNSGSGLSYSVELRDLAGRQTHCDCVDFRINGLGTCKHVEAVLLQLQARFRRLFNAAARTGSDRIELVLDAAHDTLRLLHAPPSLPRPLREWFQADGTLYGTMSPSPWLHYTFPPPQHHPELATPRR
ncbi:MAG: SWIM zinc finger domain-containing protein [Verrucomicrobia bacterium]|nr:SWIM zinc finger domain-containing protein [Verrucomicrobiota bacterium]